MLIVLKTVVQLLSPPSGCLVHRVRLDYAVLQSGVTDSYRSDASCCESHHNWEAEWTHLQDHLRSGVRLSPDHRPA